MKTVYTGLESSGKSLRLAMAACEIAWRNKKWKESSGISRPLVSNMQFSKSFEDTVRNEYGLDIFYWKDIDELLNWKNADIFIDELGTYFDSRMWAELSLDARRWVAQAAKVGVEMYASAQDFAQVDKAFRRLTNHLYLIRKVAGSRRPSATKPPVRRIWGVCLMSELDPSSYDEDNKVFLTSALFSDWFWIEKRYCDVFDTGQMIAKSAPPPLKHIERVCELASCGVHKTVHV